MVGRGGVRTGSEEEGWVGKGVGVRRWLRVESS